MSNTHSSRGLSAAALLLAGLCSLPALAAPATGTATEVMAIPAAEVAALQAGFSDSRQINTQRGGDKIYQAICQGCHMRAQGRQRGQGQVMRQALRPGPAHALQAQQGQGLQGRGGGGPGLIGGALLRRGRRAAQQGLQGGAPAPQALGTAHLQQQGLVQQGHARREAQRPPALGVGRHAGGRLNGRQMPGQP